MPLAVPTNMRLYTVANLFAGPRFDELSDLNVPANVALHAAHLEGVKQNILARKMLMAIPILSPGSTLVAMGVFRENITPEEATTIIANDPAVLAGRFQFEIHTAFFPSLDVITVEY